MVSAHSDREIGLLTRGKGKEGNKITAEEQPLTEG